MVATDTDPHVANMQQPFPLPLTPIETYMLADDRPEYPMTFVVRLAFEGRVEPAAFGRALAVALVRNPLLTARITEDARGEGRWVAGDSEPAVDFAGDDTPIQGDCAKPIDLMNESGLRTWVRTGDGGSRMLFQFHHACCDGIGAFHFVEDLLVAYANDHDGSGPDLRPLDVMRLARRGDLDIPHRSFLERWYDIWVTLRESCRLTLVPTQPLTPSGRSEKSSPPATDEGFIRSILLQDVSRRLRQAARRQAASLNDVLIRDLFLVIRDWNRECDGSNASGRLRINMPTSLRGRDDRAMPAANLMSFAFISRKESACKEPAALLESIREETHAKVRGRFSLYFLGMIDAARSLGILSRTLRRNHCFSTAVLTNMGDPTRRFVASLPRRNGLVVAGNLTLTNCSGVPPIRPLTRAVFSLCDYGKRLTIGLRCDPKSFSPADTQRLLDKYTARLAHSAE